MLTMVARSTLLALAVAASASCSGDSERSAGSATSDTTTGTDGVTGQELLPAGCTSENPFTSEGCGKALKTLCRSQDTEQACAAQGPFIFGDYEYVFACGWAKVVTFAEPDTCTVGSVTGRCEAGILAGLGCGDPCFDPDGVGFESLVAISSESELVEMPCAQGDALDGPVGEWTALANQQGDVRHAHYCGADSPPPPQYSWPRGSAWQAAETRTVGAERMKRPPH